MGEQDNTEIRELRLGVNQTGVRDHNERLILSLIQRHGAMPGTDIAKRANLSAQTVSNILRKLETDGFLERGTPQRGKVGKPSIPMALSPDGALSFGLKIGRRSADLAILNLHGHVLGRQQITYRYPMPELILDFLHTGMDAMSADLSADQRQRICGIGIAAPFEIWSWTDAIGAPEDVFQVWKDTDVIKEVKKFSDLPVFVENDATAACRAEHAFGRGREFNDYAYFFVGSFIGGGVVLDASVREGAQNNAGAFGSLSSLGADGKERQLIHAASLYLLEADIRAAGADAQKLWSRPQDWSIFEEQLTPWIERAALAIAKACLNVCAVVDFEAILIDGAFPPDVRSKLAQRVAEDIKGLDTRGLFPPRIEEGFVGADARVIGAASAPIFSQFFLK